MSSEAKPSSEEPKAITVRVRDVGNEATSFKINKTTKMKKVFDVYAQQKGVHASSLRFLKDGERIREDQTARMADLEDDDEIDCVLEQVGGLCGFY